MRIICGYKRTIVSHLHHSLRSPAPKRADSKSRSRLVVFVQQNCWYAQYFIPQVEILNRGLITLMNLLFLHILWNLGNMVMVLLCQTNFPTSVTMFLWKKEHLSWFFKLIFEQKDKQQMFSLLYTYKWLIDCFWSHGTKAKSPMAEKWVFDPFLLRLSRFKRPHGKP